MIQRDRRTGDPPYKSKNKLEILEETGMLVADLLWTLQKITMSSFYPDKRSHYQILGSIKDMLGNRIIFQLLQKIFTLL